MDDFATRYLATMLGSLAAGFFGGALAWFATNFWGRPISKFLDLRLQAQETILFHANIGPYLADADRMPKASEDLRRIAAQIGGITATSSPLILRLLRHRGYDLVAAMEHLIGLSNTLSAPLGANLDHRERAQKALRLPIIPKFEMIERRVAEQLRNQIPKHASEEDLDRLAIEWTKGGTEDSNPEHGEKGPLGR
jgi:hypothetical protein